MKRGRLGLIFLCLVLLAGCGASEEAPVKERLEYSNLVDKESQAYVKTLLLDKGLEEKNINLFLEKLNSYNETVGRENLLESGFKTIASYDIEYDELSLSENWNKKNPIFIGNNCRITSYDLLKDDIAIDRSNSIEGDNLFMDMDALDNDSIEYSKDYIDGFESFYSSIPTGKTKDINKHIEKIDKEWKDRSIGFKMNDGLSLISVFIHDDMDDVLFVGHTGLLVEDEDRLVFIEKLSFDMPYQALKFNNRLELNDYLMNKYDVSYGQDFAKPFIFENDKLLEGYRENPKNIEE